jgi:hypothetical protein
LYKLPRGALDTTVYDWRDAPDTTLYDWRDAPDATLYDWRDVFETTLLLYILLVYYMSVPDSEI